MKGIRTILQIPVLLFAFLAMVFVMPARAATENVASIAVDDFNDLWTYKASANLDTEKTKLFIMDGGAQNDNLYPTDTQGKTKKCMALKAGFQNKGFNFIELYPPKPIVIPGKARAIQLWLLGMKYNWSLELWVMDFNGMLHKMDFGSLYFEGWQSLTRIIPPQIPQQDASYPKDKPLKVIKIVLRGDPENRYDRFYFAIDQMKVISDIYQETFEGMDLINKSW